MVIKKYRFLSLLLIHPKFILPLFLSLCLYFCIYLSLYFSFSLSLSLFLFLSFSLSISLFVFFSLSLFPSFSLSLFLPYSLSLFLSFSWQANRKADCHYDKSGVGLQAKDFDSNRSEIDLLHTQECTTSRKTSTRQIFRILISYRHQKDVLLLNLEPFFLNHWKHKNITLVLNTFDYPAVVAWR